MRNPNFARALTRARKSGPPCTKSWIRPITHHAIQYLHILAAGHRWEGAKAPARTQALFKGCCITYGAAYRAHNCITKVSFCTIIIWKAVSLTWVEIGKWPHIIFSSEL